MNNILDDFFSALITMSLLASVCSIYFSQLNCISKDVGYCTEICPQARPNCINADILHQQRTQNIKLQWNRAESSQAPNPCLKIKYDGYSHELTDVGGCCFVI